MKIVKIKYIDNINKKKIKNFLSKDLKNNLKNVKKIIINKKLNRTRNLVKFMLFKIFKKNIILNNSFVKYLFFGLCGFYFIFMFFKTENIKLEYKNFFVFFIFSYYCITLFFCKRKFDDLNFFYKQVKKLIKTKNKKLNDIIKNSSIVNKKIIKKISKYATIIVLIIYILNTNIYFIHTFFKKQNYFFASFLLNTINSVSCLSSMIVFYQNLLINIKSVIITNFNFLIFLNLCFFILFLLEYFFSILSIRLSIIISFCNIFLIKIYHIMLLLLDNENDIKIKSNKKILKNSLIFILFFDACLLLLFFFIKFIIMLIFNSLLTQILWNSHKISFILITILSFFVFNFFNILPFIAIYLFLSIFFSSFFTKIADVGADILGKIYLKIEEDSQKNPLSSADNAGDIIGDYFSSFYTKRLLFIILIYYLIQYITYFEFHIILILTYKLLVFFLYMFIYLTDSKINYILTLLLNSVIFDASKLLMLIKKNLYFLLYNSQFSGVIITKNFIFCKNQEFESQMFMYFNSFTIEDINWSIIKIIVPFITVSDFVYRILLSFLYTIIGNFIILFLKFFVDKNLVFISLFKMYESLSICHTTFSFSLHIIIHLIVFFHIFIFIILLLFNNIFFKKYIKKNIYIKKKIFFIKENIFFIANIYMLFLFWIHNAKYFFIHYHSNILNFNFSQMKVCLQLAYFIISLFILLNLSNILLSICKIFGLHALTVKKYIDFFIQKNLLSKKFSIMTFFKKKSIKSQKIINKKRNNKFNFLFEFFYDYIILFLQILIIFLFFILILFVSYIYNLASLIFIMQTYINKKAIITNLFTLIMCFVLYFYYICDSNYGLFDPIYDSLGSIRKNKIFDNYCLDKKIKIYKHNRQLIYNDIYGNVGACIDKISDVYIIFLIMYMHIIKINYLINYFINFLIINVLIILVLSFFKYVLKKFSLILNKLMFFSQNLNNYKKKNSSLILLKFLFNNINIYHWDSDILICIICFIIVKIFFVDDFIFSQEFVFLKNKSIIMYFIVLLCFAIVILSNLFGAIADNNKKFVELLKFDINFVYNYYPTRTKEEEEKKIILITNILYYNSIILFKNNSFYNIFDIANIKNQKYFDMFYLIIKKELMIKHKTSRNFINALFNFDLLYNISIGLDVFGDLSKDIIAIFGINILIISKLF